MNNIQQLIGNTPLVKINYKIDDKIKTAFFKAEWFNFTGSIKDRVAYQIISDAINEKKLDSTKTIVETTSGNMGLSLCAVAKSFNIKTAIFMPEFMSEERKTLLKMYGAELHLTPDFNTAFIEAEKYAKENNGFLTLQFENESNLKAHKNTAEEILKQTNGDFTAFLAGMGTSGTLMGVGKVIKQKTSAKVIGLEPKSSQVFTKGYSLGKHKLQGLSDDIIPKLYDAKLLDDIVQVSDEDAIAMAQKLSNTFGFGVGISSGANFIGVVLTGLNKVVSVFADDNKKYLSTDLAKPITTKLVDSIELIDYEIIK